MNRIPTVFVVDDDLAVRDSITYLIRSLELNVLGFNSAEEFLGQGNLDQPGCVVLDICLPGLDGMSLQEHLAETGICLPVVMISGHADIRVSVRSMKLGAVDFLEKPFRSKEIQSAIRRAVEINAIRRKDSIRREHFKALTTALSQQEQSILHRIGLGKTSKDIARELDISLRTVQFRRSSICRKLDVSKREDLVRIASAVGSPDCERSRS